VSKKPEDAKSGRVTFDERGQSVWEWRVDTDEYSSDVDTNTVRQIQEEVNVTLLEDAPLAPPKGFDPYSTVGAPSQPSRGSFPSRAPSPSPSNPPSPSRSSFPPPLDPPKRERRTLDDMRKLSEEIKRKRALEQKK
jgi:hypothetical protein